jgi:DNA-binding CsgD family transcriptional regulator
MRLSVDGFLPTKEEPMNPVVQAPVATLSPRCPLTPRQQEVLRGLAAGKTYKQIGYELGISVSTIRSHVRCLCDGIKVINQAQAVIAAYERCWLIRPDGPPFWRIAAVNSERVPDAPPVQLRDWQDLKDSLYAVLEPIVDEMWERVAGRPPTLDRLAINTGIEKVICESARVSVEHLVEELNARGYAQVELAGWGLMGPDWWAEECAVQGGEA